ncbi:MAG: LCP family protein [Anaerofustis sp.]
MANKKIKRIVKVKKHPKKKKHFVRRVVLMLLFVALVYVALVGYQIASSLMDSLNTVDRVNIGDTDDALMINDGVSAAAANSGVINIALFGLDARADETASRSDTIIVLSVDTVNHDITLTSILRDTYIGIPDEYYSKINAAYFIGGPELAVQTLNTNFDLDIHDYITVDFSAIADIVDAVGGVEITVSEDEVDALNGLIFDSNRLLGGTLSPYISAGTQVLDGKQALAYCRIRKLGNGDFDRTARQREVIEQILDAVKTNFSPDLITRMASAVSDDISTSMSNKELFHLAWEVFRARKTVQMDSLTDSTYLKSATIDGSMVLVTVTQEDAVKDLHSIIYGDTAYTPSAEVEALSKKLKKITNQINYYTIDTDPSIAVD